jgi:hypothetical protein
MRAINPVLFKHATRYKICALRSGATLLELVKKREVFVEDAITTGTKTY